MKLKAFLKDLKEVDEKFHDLYTKTDDGFVLDIDDGDYKSKIGEFRGNNIELKKKIEKLENDIKKFADVDPEKARQALAKLQELEEKEMLDAGKIDELLAQRTERMRSDYDSQTKTLIQRAEAAEKAATEYKQRLNRIEVDGAITKAIADVAAPRKGAMSDILARASNVWSLDDEGKLVAKDSHGNTIYAKDGKAPMTPAEWAQTLQQDAPFLFEPNSGGGAQGGNQKQGQNNGTKVVSVGDRQAFSANLEKIATGEVQVR